MFIKKKFVEINNYLKKDIIFIPLLISLFALFLRLIGIGFESIWVDEAISIAQSSQTFDMMIYLTGLDVHPPLFNTILFFWIRLFGDGAIAVRFISAIFGSMSVYLIYILANKIYGKKFALVSSMLLALSAFHIYFSQEARMYTLLVFLVLINSLFFLDSNNKKFKRYYIITSILMVYTHIFAWLVIGFQFIYDFIYKKRNLNLFKPYIIIFISYLPWIYFLIKQISTVSSSFWIPKPDFYSIQELFFRFSGVEIINLYFFTFLFFLGIIFMIFDFYKSKEKSKENLYLILWFFVPIIIVYLFSILFIPIFSTRYFLFCLPAFLLIITYSLKKINEIKKISFLVPLFIIILLILSSISVINNYENRNKPDWENVAQYIDQNKLGYESILLDPEYTLIPFLYYYDTFCFKHDTHNCAKSKNIYTDYQDINTNFIYIKKLGRYTGDLINFDELGYNLQKVVEFDGVLVKYYIKEN